MTGFTKLTVTTGLLAWLIVFKKKLSDFVSIIKWTQLHENDKKPIEIDVN